MSNPFRRRSDIETKSFLFRVPEVRGLFHARIPAETELEPAKGEATMIKLWNQTMPHRCVEDAFEPYLTPYDCDAKTAIVECPGGACGRADYEEQRWRVVEYHRDNAFVLGIPCCASKSPGAANSRPQLPGNGRLESSAWAMDRNAPRHHGLFRRGGHCTHYDEAFTRRRMSLTIYLPALVTRPFAIV